MQTKTPNTTAMAAHSTQTPLNPHKRITARTVRELCGGVSDMSLHRWLNNPELNFPKPIFIGRRRYWHEAKIVQWLDARDGVA